VIGSTVFAFMAAPLLALLNPQGCSLRWRSTVFPISFDNIP